MRALGALVLSICSVLWFGGPVHAEKRVALVIGNSAYENVSRLGNPANDAAAMTTTLQQAGFDVVESRHNLKISEMRRAFRDFADKARDADVAVVYYAGHGIEVDGTNYLIPVDAALERDLDVYDEALPLDRILVTIEPARQLRLVILDACRDNPFSKTMKRTLASRAIGRGLAKVEPTSPNTLIAFASKAGSTASDGDSKNSPFTSALVKHITTPGLDLRKAFGYVRDDVLRNTGNKQEPYVYGSLGGDDVPLVPAKPTTLAPAPSNQADMRRDYELAERVGTRDVWTAFLAQYPEGLYASLAKGQLNKIAAEEARVAATEKARLAQEEKARLAAEGAKANEQARAAREAKAAEEARVAAEKQKAIEAAKVETERANTAAKAKAASEAKAASDAKAAEEARIAAEKQKAIEAARVLEAERASAAAQAKLAEQNAQDTKAQDNKPPGPVAALMPSEQAVKPAPPAAADIPRLLQTELRRVGCSQGAVDGDWNAASQRSLALFNKNAGTRLDVKVASLDALDMVKGRTARICPLICDHGFKADGETCTRITCKPGYEVGDDNTCQKTEVKKPARPVAKREEPAAAPKPAASAAEPKTRASGQVLCDPQGCRPVAQGCRIIQNTTIGQRQVCN
ncbi:MULTISPECIES: caspase family protein [Bradyrhizobium]|jgi:hypothetical protein|uniref:Uncharacterized protein, contains caspase domain n=2 Tax=Bradyrhizobium TaxID=374 RepID=A0ABY0PZR8_9BRAD|nr:MULTISPECIES: caspase family protein [Bradyrhizobium]SDJ22700.1 Uncharacterized protein, contains caspase domain [Bradyrhizobium ottawaense]SEC79156.1 Uncharacterized protein, contains caspase domain [Bradyrhizobium lablabi]SHK90587.1 Uncharacterized protein, contains caspase domain [Bradyrhizobium lablabi]